MLDVAVVGGGLAGLAAAVTLARAGAEVELLEARPRFGGRVLTLRGPFDDGLYAEAGPEFIASGHEVLREFLREYGFRLAPRQTGPRLLYFQGRVARGWWVGDYGEQAAAEAARIEQATARLARLIVDPAQPWTSPVAAELDGQSLGTWLDELSLEPLVRAFQQLWITIDYGVEPEQLSLLMYARDERLIELSPERPPEYLQEGLGRLPEAMAADLGRRVRPSTRVTALVQDRDAVTVHYRAESGDGTIRARHVVVAVPLSVLRQLRLEPPPEPPRREVFERLHYSHVLKVHLQFRRRFWREQGPLAGLMTDLPLQSAWDSTHAQPGERGILTVYTAGRSALRLRGLPTEQRADWCLEQLEQLFPRCRKAYERSVSVDWDADPLTLGAYSHFAPGELTRYGPWLARPAGRIHFAGEHTDHWQATLNGALNSGRRAAREVLDRLGT